jgi:hypothetical protein
MRFFNTAGPVNCDKHYCLPPLSRFNLPEILRLIAQENIKAESLRLGNFTFDEVRVLYQQHTDETGQMPEGRDRSNPVTYEMISQAKENLIMRRETHLDQLADKLREARVRKVIEPMLRGEDLGSQVSQDDLGYVIWLERFDYRAAGPQLLMQAFIQRIVNGGGCVEREYGLGRGRTDLLVIWPYPGGVQRAVIELKVLHKSRAQVRCFFRTLSYSLFTFSSVFGISGKPLNFMAASTSSGNLSLYWLRDRNQPCLA